MTGSCSTPVAMLLTPPSARALLQALSHCLAFDASTAAMLLAASAPQNDMLQLLPVLPSLANGPDSEPAEGRKLLDLSQHDDPPAPASQGGQGLHQTEGNARDKLSGSNSSDPALSTRDSQKAGWQLHPAGVPLALQLITKPESYAAVCGVASMLGHIAHRQGVPAC